MLQNLANKFLLWKNERPGKSETVTGKYTYSPSNRDTLAALAPGNKKKGIEILLAYEALYPQKTSRRSVVFENLLDQGIKPKDPHVSLHVVDPAFSWLADIASTCYPQEPDVVIKAVAKHLFQKHLTLINAFPNPHSFTTSTILAPATACQSLQDIYDTLLRVVRIWTYSYLFKYGKNNDTLDLALSVSIRDIIALELSLKQTDTPAPVFARINIYMILSVFEQLITNQQQSVHNSDPFLEELSSHYQKILKHSNNQQFRSFTQHVRNGNSLRLKNLSAAFGHCFNEEHGQALFSQDPIVHAHLFIWLYATYKIISRYITIHHTLRVRLQQLCTLLADFCLHKTPSKKQENPDLAFLSLCRFSPSLYNVKTIFPPPANTLLQFISAAKKDFPPEGATRNPALPINILGFQQMQTKHLALQICLETPDSKLLSAQENYLINPLSMSVHTGKFHHQNKTNTNTEENQILFGQPHTPFPPQSPHAFLQYTGTGIGFCSKSVRASYIDESHHSTLPLELSSQQKAQRLQRILSDYQSQLSGLLEAKNINFNIVGLQLKSEELLFIRHILFDTKNDRILGIDQVISQSPIPRQRNLLCHASFFCPQHWLIRQTSRHATLLITQKHKKILSLWDFRMLTPPNGQTTPGWEITPHPDGANWIFCRFSPPHSGQFELAWMLSSANNKNKPQSKNSPLYPSLFDNKY